MEELNNSVSKVDLMHLFTINTKTKERFYIGKLRNVERLYPHNYPEKAKEEQASYFNEMKRQLLAVDADVHELDKSPLIFNVRFKKEDIFLFQDYLPIVSARFNEKYHRTLPFRMNSDLRKMLSDVESTTSFTFIPSSPSGKLTSYTRFTTEGQTGVSKVHQEIEESLYAYLQSIGVSKDFIACDTASFGGKLADVVVKHDSINYSIYEIKTNMDLRKGFRESLGQLLDYANWENKINVNELVSVIPDTQTGPEIMDYIERVKQSLNLKLRVLLYDKSKNTFREV